MPDERQEVRRIVAEVARAVDRRLAVEVRELPGGERLQLLTQGNHHTQTEVPVVSVLAAAESPMARNELRLRVKRATDTMLFKPMLLPLPPRPRRALARNSHRAPSRERQGRVRSGRTLGPSDADVLYSTSRSEGRVRPETAC